jgi:amino acid permease
MPGSNPALEQEIQKKATNAIIAAVVGFFCCPLVQIYTIILANDALGQIKQSGAGQQHQTLATVAKIVAIVHLCLVGAVIVLQIALMALGLGAAAVGN